MPIVEEIDLGAVTSKLSTGLEKLQATVGPVGPAETTPAEATPAESASAEATPEAAAPAAQPSRPATLDDLKTVYNALGADTCLSIDDVVQMTGLPEDVVIQCINLLSDYKFIANATGSKKAAVFCGVAAVKKLINQLQSISA